MALTRDGVSGTPALAFYGRKKESSLPVLPSAFLWLGVSASVFEATNATPLL